MNADLLKPYLELGREYRLKTLKINGVEVEFGPHITPISPDELAKLATVKIGAEHGNPTEDEFLFMSSQDGAPEHKAEPPP